MSTASTTALIGSAVLLFWIVGAYNRIVRLRQELVRRFAPVDTQMKERHALLLRLTELLGTTLASAQPRLDALRAASLQGDAARDHARVRPSVGGTIKSLRLAEEIVVETRSRVPMQRLGGHSELADVTARLAVVDSDLGFARREFNEAVSHYNRAVGEFPTVVLSALMGFRPGEPL